MWPVREKAGRKSTLTVGVHFQDGFLGLEGKETHPVTTLLCTCLSWPTGLLLLHWDTPHPVGLCRSPRRLLH